MKIRHISFEQITLSPGFWQKRQEINAYETIPAVYDRFAESGRFEALQLNWKPGKPKPHIFWDSDTAKWMEAAAYVIHKTGDTRLTELVDGLVEDLAACQEPCGYLNSWFQQFEPDQRFTRRTDHELYCAGHLMEAAVAYHRATGKDKLLRIVCRYADYIEKVFVIEKTAAFVTPGHPEIELALVRLYEETGEERYLNLARFFIDQRGCQPEGLYDDMMPAYAQSHLPVREQRTAEGHAVRACYLYSAMADLARYDQDEALLTACRSIFDNIRERRMYITGGIGSASAGEAFTVDYDLPNLRAYSESCAAISLIFFARRMLLCELDRKYADVIERVLYNGFLSSVSLDGRAFFYENPLEIQPAFLHRNQSLKNTREPLPITQRVELFDCSCCPPNIARMMATVADTLYTRTDDTLHIHQFMAGTACFDGIQVRQETRYPENGRIEISVTGFTGEVMVRIPGWCTSWQLRQDGEPVTPTLEKGYARVTCKGETSLVLELDMTPQRIEANPLVTENAGRVAITRGPVVYCAEGVDNGDNIHSLWLPRDAVIREGELWAGCPLLHTEACRPAPSEELYRPVGAAPSRVPLTLIPYFAFANRGESEMLVWLMER